MSDKLSVFVPFAKFDEATGEVWGTIAEEAPDRSGEIMDYERSKPYFKAWSDSQHEASGGKSLGNVREMHGKNAVGKLVQLDFDDASKKINFGAQILDPLSIQKVRAGVLTGVSIGGDYVGKREPEEHPTLGKLLRYVANPQEVSLVDRPCMPGALLSIVKADGTSETVPLVGRTLRQVWACGAAEGCMHDAKADAVKCDGGPMEKRNKLAESGAATKTVPEGVKKCLYQIAALAGALNSIEWVHDAEEMESEQEGDQSQVPDKIKAGISALYDALVAMVEEEAAEWEEEEGGEMAMAVASTLEKVCSKPDRLRELLAKRAEQEEHEMKPEELQKVVGATEEKLAKVMSDGFEKLASTIAENEAAGKTRFEKLEADVKLIKDNTPEKSEIAKREPPIEKNKDTRDTDPPKSKEPETVLELTKRALSPENAYQIGG